MTACTDDERRLIAARLRMSDERDAAGFVDCLLAEVVRGREFCETPCEECHARLLGELADLIDPDESGQNQDTNPDTVQIESPAVQIAPECDREALLALASGLEADADRILRASRNARFGGGPSMGEAKHDAYEWRSIARRIREALGVES